MSAVDRITEALSEHTPNMRGECDLCGVTVDGHPRALSEHQAEVIAALPEISIVERPAHGTSRRYEAGCRCADCTNAARLASQERRQRHYAARVEQGGVMVHPNAKHGTQVGYRNYGCRCQPCVDAHNAKKRAERAKARAAGAR